MKLTASCCARFRPVDAGEGKDDIHETDERSVLQSRASYRRATKPWMPDRARRGLQRRRDGSEARRPLLTQYPRAANFLYYFSLLRAGVVRLRGGSAAPVAVGGCDRPEQFCIVFCPAVHAVPLWRQHAAGAAARWRCFSDLFGLSAGDGGVDGGHQLEPPHRLERRRLWRVGGGVSQL